MVTIYLAAVKAWPTLDRVAQTGAEWDRQTRKLNNARPAGAAGRVAGGEWQMADDGGQMADDEYGVSLGGCVAGNSSEPMAQAHPDVPAEEDQEPKKAPNKANLESTQTSSAQKVESGLTGPAGRTRSHSRDETEIQRREERPAAFLKKLKEGGKTKLSRKATALAGEEH